MIHKLYQAKRFSNAESSRLLSDYVPTTSTPSSPAQVNGKNGYTAINHRTRMVYFYPPPPPKKN